MPATFCRLSRTSFGHLNSISLMGRTNPLSASATARAATNESCTASAAAHSGRNTSER